ncbi:MAG: WD40/YVTN/BNR-like repeat-containing protein [Bacilli bacterium]
MKSQGMLRAASIALVASAAIMLSGCGVAAQSQPSRQHSAQTLNSRKDKAIKLPSVHANASRVPIDSAMMVSPLYGWGWSSNRPGQRVALWRTQDGANHWVPVQLPFKAIANIVVNQVAFDPINSTTIWVAVVTKHGDQIYRTTDGGQRWTQQAPVQTKDGVISLLQFVDPTHGWLITDSGIGMPDQATYHLYQTVDGGAAWKLISSSGKGQHAIPSAGDGVFRFQNASSGWMTAQSVLNGRVSLYVTRDGGAAWKAQTLPFSSSYKNALITTETPTFAGNGNGVMPVLFYGSGTHASTVVYLTENDGNIWKPQRALNTSLPVAVDFLNVSHGWATNAPWSSNNPILYRTSNAGKTWSIVSRSHELNNTNQLEFVSPQVGFAETSNPKTGAVGLAKTTNGGISWTRCDMMIQ